MERLDTRIATTQGDPILNDLECKEFVTRLIKKFPGFDDQARNLADEQKREIYRGWAEAWRDDITLAECNAVLDRLAIDGNITTANYREPGPFIRRLVNETRSKARADQNRRQRSIERIERLEAARLHQAEYQRYGRSITNALQQLQKGVSTEEAIQNA